MIKHPPADDAEATMAALAYLPGLAPIVYLTLEAGKPQYFLRYHVGHALLLNLTTFLVLGLIAVLGFIPGAPGAAYLLTGGVISLIMLGVTLVHALAGIQAYRKRLVVFPLLTPLYYRFFSRP